MEKKMPDHVFLSKSRLHQFLSFLISELTFLCYFILSHPLYFSYFVFFSPYLVKLLSFLSPLFITTSLLLLALLTNIYPAHSVSSSPDSDKVSSVLLSFYHALLEADVRIDEFDRLEDFDVYNIVFQEIPIEFFYYTSTEGREKSVLDSSDQEKDSATVAVDLENSGEMECNNGVAVEEFLKEMDEFESKNCAANVDRMKIQSLKVVEKKQKEEMIMGNGSNEVDTVKNAHSWSNLEQNLDNINNNNLGNYGSMRKEKEWTRTLACKLYEERHNASDSSGEGMDLLWETYELDPGNSKAKRDNNTKKKMKKKGESKSYKKDEEDDEDMNEQLCCLQALKFSAGKMNIGMGRPNLVKISKAIRGFGWLHHVSKKNKVHCGDRF